MHGTFEATAWTRHRSDHGYAAIAEHSASTWQLLQCAVLNKHLRLKVLVAYQEGF
jgi:hypothetical protein